MSTSLLTERPSIEVQLASKKKQREAPASIYQADFERFGREYMKKLEGPRRLGFEIIKPKLQGLESTNVASNVPRQECNDVCTVHKKRGKKAIHPSDVACTCCNSHETKLKNNQSKTPLWYRWQGLGWFCHRCYYRKIMRAVKGIKPENYRKN